MHRKFTELTAVRDSVRLRPFSSSFDHRTLLIIWIGYIFILTSVGKYDIVRAVSFVAFPVFMIIADRLSPAAIISRIILLSPFAIIMAAANPLLDRTVYLSVGVIPISGGMLSAAVIVCKAVLALAMMIILDKCISIRGLCDALHRIGVPTVFTTQLLLMHRYIFLIITEAAAMIRARDLRVSGKWGKGPVVTANLIGTLLLRCAERSDRVYRSMLARGFTGTLPSVTVTRFSGRDILFLVITFSLFVVLRWLF